MTPESPHSRTASPSSSSDEHLRARIGELEAQLVRSQAALASSLDPIVTIDEHGKVLQASDSVERMFGYPSAEFIGDNIRVLMPEPHRSRHDSYLEKYRRTGITNILNSTREFEVLRKDGTRILCDLSIARAQLPSGEANFIGVFRDVTERKQAEERLRNSERRFHAIFDGTFQYVGLLRPDGTVLEANQAALDAAGLKRADVEGRPFWETHWWTFSHEIQARVRDSVRAASGGAFVRFEVQVRGRGDELLDLDFSLKPVRDDAGRVILIIPEGRDITALKRAQRSETQMLRALATVGEQAAVLAHEIKNPITAVNLALRAVADSLGADHTEVLGDLVARMQRLEMLMRGTLSFVKAVELRRTRVDLDSFLKSCVAHLAPLLARAQASVEINVEGAGLALSADPQRLEEVIANLVTNAAEAVNGPVRIRVHAHARRGSDVVLEIEDDGPGLQEKVRAALFKPFVTTKPEGTGLGLAICRKIVEAHGATIEAGSSNLGGARFVLHFKEVLHP